MTKKVLKIFILISALVYSTQAQGQSNCVALIQQGLYDTYSESTSSSSYSQMVNNFCSSYSQYLNNQYDSSESDENSAADSSINGNSNSVAGSVGFMGFGASAGYSTSNLNGQSSSYSNANSESLSTGQIQAIAGFLCTGNSDTQASSGSLEELSSVIDPAVLSAYNDCLAQSQAGLQVSTTVQGDQNQVTITVYYEAPIGAPDEITLDAITISPSGSWSCSGSLWNAIPDDSDAASAGTSLTNNALGMTCSRTISSTNMSYLGQSVYAVPSSITIFTSAGTVLRSFAPIYASPPVSLVGTNIQETCSDFNLYSDSVLTILSATCQSNSGENIANSIELLNCPGFSAMLDNQIFASAYAHDILGDSLFQQSVSNYNTWLPSNMSLVGTTLTGTFVCHGCTNWAFGIMEGGVATNAEEEIMSDLSDYFTPQTLSIDLSNFISNHDGYLVCNF